MRKGWRIRWIALILLLALLIPISASAEKSAEQDWYLARAEELTADLFELMNSDEYLELNGLEDDEIELIAQWREVVSAETAEPERYTSVISMIMPAFLTIENFPEAAKKKHDGLAGVTAINSANAQKGVLYIRASAVLSVASGYIMPEDFEPCILLYEYDGICIAVDFAHAGEEVVSAGAYIVAPEVKEYLIRKGETGNEAINGQLGEDKQNGVPAAGDRS